MAVGQIARRSMANHAIVADRAMNHRALDEIARRWQCESDLADPNSRREDDADCRRSAALPRQVAGRAHSEGVSPACDALG